jgi:hypothetical protein
MTPLLPTITPALKAGEAGATGSTVDDTLTNGLRGKVGKVDIYFGSRKCKRHPGVGAFRWGLLED